jgi:hypothetical protein
VDHLRKKCRPRRAIAEPNDGKEGQCFEKNVNHRRVHFMRKGRTVRPFTLALISTGESPKTGKAL